MDLFLERMLAFHCAPALEGLKPANMVCCGLSCYRGLQSQLRDLEKAWDEVDQQHTSIEDSVDSTRYAMKNLKNHLYDLAEAMDDSSILDGVGQLEDAIDGMLDKFEEGCDVVYGVRSSRQSDTFFKRTTAEGYYTVMEKLGVDLVFNHADFRLMSRRAMAALAQFKEVNLFLRGMVPLVGFQSDVVTYERSERFAGESKYPLSKMLALAFEGVTSFSTKPIKWISNVGIAAGVLGVVLTVINLVRMFLGAPGAGLAALISSLWIMGGLVLAAVGIVGSYVGKAYLETKGRPRYIVEEFLHDGEDETAC